MNSVAVEADTQTDRLPHSRDLDPAFLDFLHDRLCEEILAATRRRELSDWDGERAEIAERGLRLLDELTLDIKHGRPSDPMMLGLLRLCFGKHPEFRPEWVNRA